MSNHTANDGVPLIDWDSVGEPSATIWPGGSVRSLKIDPIPSVEDPDSPPPEGGDTPNTLPPLGSIADVQEESEGPSTIPAHGPQKAGAIDVATTAEGTSNSGGTSAGRLELLRHVADGGMGEVWAAIQHPLNRLVAVKRIRSDKWTAHADKEDTRKQLSREFTNEALIAALLEHPNIVPVHAMTEAVGREAPALAMKLVRGDSWDTILRRDFDALTPEELLAKHLPILEDSAQALAFAHSRGIIHRDFKPSQVMVGPYGETLVMDWGLALQYAKLEGDELYSSLTAELDVDTLPTLATASNPAGTPVLMAPEQTEKECNRLGPWTDAYLLGGTLYFIITGGRWPHRGDTTREVLLAARKGVIVPPSEMAPGRNIPAPLERLAMAALRANPVERLSEVEDFLTELRDYLRGLGRRRESVELTSSARAEVEELFAARASNPAPEEVYPRHAAAAATLSRALELWPENAEARTLAARNLEARTEAEIAAGDLLQARLHVGELEDIRAGVDRATIRDLDARIEAARNRRIRADRQRMVLTGLTVLLFIVLTSGAAKYMIDQKLAGERLAEQVDIANENLQLAGRNLEISNRSLQIARKQGEDAFELIEYVLEDLKGALDEELTLERGITYPVRDQVAHAIAGKVASPITSYYDGSDNTDWPDGLRLQRARQMASVGNKFRELGRFDEAARLVIPATELVDRLAGTESEEAARAWKYLGDLHRELGRYEEAADAYMKSRESIVARFGTESLEAAGIGKSIGNLHSDMGYYREAEEILRDSLRVRVKLLGERTFDASQSMNDLAEAIGYQGRHDEALDLFRQAYEISKETVGEYNDDTLRKLNNVAATLAHRDEFVEALTILKRVLELERTVLSATHPSIGITYANIAAAHYQLGELEEASRNFELAREIQSRVFGENHPDVINTRSIIYRVMEAEGDVEGAIEGGKQLIADAEEVLGPGHQMTLHHIVTLAIRQRTAKRPAGALASFQRAYETILTRPLDYEYKTTADIAEEYAKSHFLLQNYREARRIVVEWYQVLNEAGDKEMAERWMNEDFLLPIDASLARQAFAEGETEEAREAAQSAVSRFDEAILTGARGPRNLQRAAEVLMILDRHEEARPLVEALHDAGYESSIRPVDRPAYEMLLEYYSVGIIEDESDDSAISTEDTDPGA